MAINLFDHQIKALDKLRSGSILCGGVGSGKSRTAIAYYYIKECKGSIKINGKGEDIFLRKPKELYIITTARKRDTLDWLLECAPFCIPTELLHIDSWNNILKYINVKDAFFIFDEQRVVGSGTWVKSFLKITKNNNWILLSATPGDTWMDYIPVFIANRFYKNRTEFIRRHVIYNRFTRYPKIDKFVDTSILERYRRSITVDMPFYRSTIRHEINIPCLYDKKQYDIALKERWNIFENKPIQDITQLCYILRRIVNDTEYRIEAIDKIFKKHKRIIIFYNFNYELERLKQYCNDNKIIFTEWNGHKHERIPNVDKWIYLVQYTAGSEGWNCIETDTTVFYSQTYSYKALTQACGRIDRLNTPFKDLYYYYLRTTSSIDLAIKRSLNSKSDFNEHDFISFKGSQK